MKKVLGLLLPLLNCIGKGIIGDQVAVVELKVCHRRSYVAAIQPSIYCVCFVRKTICCYLWIFHDFLDKEIQQQRYI